MGEPRKNFQRGFRNRYWATGMPVWGRGFYGPYPPYYGPYPPAAPGYGAWPAAEGEALKAQAEYLEEQLELVKRRLAELSGPDAGEKKGKEQE